LTNGLNTVTLHAADLAGNTATTNFSVTLDYSTDTTPPVLNLIWPQDGTAIGGGNFSVQAQVDDATATVMASLNGGTNTFQGVVERSGAVWFNNLPLAEGTNTLSLTATDAAGNASTTNITLIKAAVSVTMDPLPDDQLNQSLVSVTGTISDSGYTLTVNGVEADVNDDGTWEADTVPVSPTGTAVFDAEIYVGDPEGAGSQWFNQIQPAVISLMSYTSHYLDEGNGNSCPNGSFLMTHEVVNWRYQSGGADSWSGEGNSDCVPISSSGTTSLAGGYNGYSPTWEIKTFSGSSYEVPFWVYMIYIDTWAYIPYWSTESWNGDAHACVMIVPSGQAAIGTTALYLVQAQVMDEDSGLQLPGSQVQIRGTTPMDVTNADGSVWSQTLVTAPAGATNVEVTPKASVQKISYNGMQVQVEHLSIIDSNSGVDLTLQTNTVIVGQQMNWYCQLCLTNYGLTNPPLSNFQWTVPGYAISNYVVAADSSSAMVVTNFPLNNSNVVFYWVDGASSRTVQCSATVNGKAVTGQATFNVLKPSADLLAFTNGSAVSIDANYAFYSGTVLHFGTDAQLAGQTNWGTRFYATNLVLNGCPSDAVFFFVQTGIIQAEHNYTNGTSSRYTGSGLDTQYPAFLPFSATEPWWHDDDPPGEPADGSSQVWRSDHFTMYLLYQVNSANSIPVPLKKLDWSWSGVAQTNGVGGWQLLSASVALQNVNVSAGYPTWTNNTITGTNITSNQWINPFP